MIHGHRQRRFSSPVYRRALRSQGTTPANIDLRSTIALQYTLVSNTAFLTSPRRLTSSSPVNDPNGMHRDASGLWHLYYQYNPTESVPGDVHWGHATSQDLYHWENQKIALWPFNTTTQVFSGSGITDPNNTSGFFPHQDNGVVAFYISRRSPNAEPCN